MKKIQKIIRNSEFKIYLETENIRKLLIDKNQTGAFRMYLDIVSMRKNVSSLVKNTKTNVLQYTIRRFYEEAIDKIKYTQG
jgi:hypothetical protein